MAELFAEMGPHVSPDDDVAPDVPVLLLVLEFALPGALSIKDKRRALGGLRQRFGKATGLAACESGYQNDLRRAQWSFIATAADRRVAEQSLAAVEEFAATRLDAQLLSCTRHELN